MLQHYIMLSGTYNIIMGITQVAIVSMYQAPFLAVWHTMILKSSKLNILLAWQSCVVIISDGYVIFEC